MYDRRLLKLQKMVPPSGIMNTCDYIVRSSPESRRNGFSGSQNRLYSCLQQGDLLRMLLLYFHFRRLGVLYRGSSSIANCTSFPSCASVRYHERVRLHRGPGADGRRGCVVDRKTERFFTQSYHRQGDLSRMWRYISRSYGPHSDSHRSLIHWKFRHHISHRHKVW